MTFPVADRFISSDLILHTNPLLFSLILYKPVDEIQDALFLWLTDGDAWLNDAEKRGRLPQVDAFEQLKRVDGDQEKARALIALGRLPYEVVTGVWP